MSPRSPGRAWGQVRAIRLRRPSRREGWAPRYSRWVVRWRWAVVAGWALGLVVLVVVPPVASGGDELASIIPLDSPAIQAELRSVEAFGFPLSSRTAVIQHDPAGLSVYTQAESVLDALALDQRTDLRYPLLGAIPVTNAARLAGGSGESNTAVLTYLFMDPGSSFADQSAAAQRYIDEYLDRPQDHVVGITGSVPARAQQAFLVAESLPRLEQLTVLAILLLVGLTFRSLVAPVIALGASGIAFLVTLHLSHIVGVALASLAVLGVASLPLAHVNLGVGFTSSLPPDNTVARAAKAASQAFAPGITSTTTLLIEGPRVTDRLAELSQLQRRVQAEPGVAGVIGPAQNFTQRSFNVVLSKDGGAARMLVVLDHDPLDAVAIDNFGQLRERLPLLAAESGLADARISAGGDTALAEGLVSSTGTDLYRIALAGIVVNLLLLVIFLRALVAPLYLLASSILALTASLGLTVWTSMDLGGSEGLTFYVPFAVAVLLVSLGSDYNIFGVGRIWDEARHRPLNAAIIKAVPESARAITAAGLTLAVSFGMLATIPLSPFRELGFAMACGILIDAFLVRSLLMPSLLVLVGPASGWPGPNLRRARSVPRPPWGRPRPAPADPATEPS